jgi:hypothetical protein
MHEGDFGCEHCLKELLLQYEPGSQQSELSSQGKSAFNTQLVEVGFL